MPFPIQDLTKEAHIPNATDATNQIVMIAPYDLKVISIQSRHRVASTSGTMDLVKAASGTAVSAGTSLLTGTMSIAGAADTNVNGTVKVAAIGDNVVPKGSALALLFGGTLTNLLDLDVTIVVRQLKKQ